MVFLCFSTLLTVMFEKSPFIFITYMLFTPYWPISLSSWPVKSSKSLAVILSIFPSSSKLVIVANGTVFVILHDVNASVSCCLINDSVKNSHLTIYSFECSKTVLPCVFKSPTVITPSYSPCMKACIKET